MWKCIPLRKGKHEGLVSLETFQRAQDRIHGKAKVPARADIKADFPLRGFVLCGDCGKSLTACWSKSKTGAKHPYYQCFNKECESHRKSIPRAQIEGEFEKLLAGVTPSAMMVGLVKDMLKKAWSMLGEHEAAYKHSLKQELIGVEKKVEKLLDKIVEANNVSVVSAYEQRIDRLEKEKLVLAEKLEKTGQFRRSFDMMFKLAMQFFANPCHLWHSDRLDDKQAVLKLSFDDKLFYHRNEGFRTPRTSRVFAALEQFCIQKSQMAV